MPKYRKKPVVIEAIQSTDDSPDTIHKIKQFAGDKVTIDEHSVPVLVNIHTLEGTMTVYRRFYHQRCKRRILSL